MCGDTRLCDEALLCELVSRRYLMGVFNQIAKFPRHRLVLAYQPARLKAVGRFLLVAETLSFVFFFPKFSLGPSPKGTANCFARVFACHYLK